MPDLGSSSRSLALLLAVLLSVSACNSSAERGEGDPSLVPATAPESDAVQAVKILAPRGLVPLEDSIAVQSREGRLTALKITAVGEEPESLTGELTSDGTRWTTDARLEPGSQYVGEGSALRSDGSSQPVRFRFHTAPLPLSELTYPSVAPLQGETVGVGMPVVVNFDLPVQDKQLYEKNMSVRSEPSQPGSWHWLSDREAHWRPKAYWQPGTDVAVDVDVNSLPAGQGIYGQESREVSFTVGDSIVSKIDVQAHQMNVYRNGKLARSMRISAGKPGWETRSGTKVIIEKFRSKRMSAATIGVDEDDPEFYDLADVEYALRVTYSGEFLHAAPWSAGSQGSANVSHGCVGMSTADAEWLYNTTRRGDVVEVTGSDRQMTLENGFGDWNLPFKEYQAGSALL